LLDLKQNKLRKNRKIIEFYLIFIQNATFLKIYAPLCPNSIKKSALPARRQLGGLFRGRPRRNGANVRRRREHDARNLRRGCSLFDIENWPRRWLRHVALSVDPGL